jgi:hypothetical protein
MARFIAIHRQNGGCDYTIACGIAVEVFEADTAEAARQRVIDHYADCENMGDESAARVKSVELRRLADDEDLRIGSHEWMTVRNERQQAADRARVEETERAEYARLQGKYGKTKGSGS